MIHEPHIAAVCFLYVLRFLLLANVVVLFHQISYWEFHLVISELPHLTVEVCTSRTHLFWKSRSVH